MTGKYADVRFYGDLAELAWSADRLGHAEVTFDASRSVKDVIESCGVPHTEVDLILVNGQSVGFDRQIRDGDRVSVFPTFHHLDVGPLTRVRPPALGPRFALDVHLGRLSERLRLLGFDCLYRNDFDDADLAWVGSRDRRWVLTRDRGLLMRRSVMYGYCLRSHDPTEQTVEVINRFDLADQLRPFTRCTRCNGELHAVEKAAIEHRLEPGTRQRHDEFRECAGCGHLYWDGSHTRKLHAFIEDVRAATRGRGGTRG